MRMAAAFLIILLFGCISAGQEQNGAIENRIIEPANGPANENKEQPKQGNDAVLTSETVFPEPEIFEFSRTINGSYVVYFFHSEGCSACRESYPTISELKNKHLEIIFINYSLATASGSRAYAKFADLNNLSRDKRLVPQVYVNGTIITDRFNIEEKLGQILSELK